MAVVENRIAVFQQCLSTWRIVPCWTDVRNYTSEERTFFGLALAEETPVVLDDGKSVRVGRSSEVMPSSNCFCELPNMATERSNAKAKHMKIAISVIKKGPEVIEKTFGAGIAKSYQ